MIRVLTSGLSGVTSDAVLRSVSSTLESDTPFSRELEVRAGSQVSDRLRSMGELPVGAAVITQGGELPVGFLIHVVLHSAEEPVTRESVRSALMNGLRRAEEWGLSTLALSPLGTGPGNMDAEEAASVMVPVLSHHLRTSEHFREFLILVGTEYEHEVFARAAALAAGDVDASRD